MDLPYDTILEILTLLELERSSHPAAWSHTRTILQPSLFSICLLNKTWNEAATELLYRDVFLLNSRAHETFISTLQSRKDLCSYVRSFFSARAYARGLEAEPCTIPRDKCSELECIYSMCPNLHSHVVTARGARPNTEFLGWQELNFGAVTRLEMGVMGVVPDAFSPSLSLPLLEDLVVRGMKFVVGRKVSSPWPRMPRLRRLCLIDCDFSPAVMCLPKFENGERGLRALEIAGGDYSGYGLSEAIRRTCRYLELLTFIPSLSVPLACDFPSLTMARVLDDYLEYFTLNSRLPNLVHLASVGNHGNKRNANYDFVDRRTVCQRSEQSADLLWEGTN